MRSLIFLPLWITLTVSLSAQEQRTLDVGIRETPPFSFKDAAGEWTGITVDLWEQAATELNIAYSYEELELEPLLEQVAAGDIGLGVGAITATAEREEILDFTHPFYIGGLGIATRQESGGFGTYVRAVVTPGFIQAILALAVVLFIFGLLLWVFERKKNAEQFGGPAHEGLGKAFWWSAVTMTTVGYGDKAPTTLGGRIIGLVWMFAAIMIISSLTAAIASALTAYQLQGVVRGADDLYQASVGTVADSTSERYLREARIRARGYADVDALISAIESGEIDAAVYDRPILRWALTNLEAGDVGLLPEILQIQPYAFPVTADSPLREELNREVLRITTEPDWGDTLREYLGE